MKKYWILFVLFILLTSCSSVPGDETIQTAIAQTSAADVLVEEILEPEPTETTIPTNTPYPTYTPYPTPTPPPTLTPEIIIIEPTTTNTPTRAPQSEFIDIIRELVEKHSDIERVSLVKGENGILVIEFFTQWASRDRQPIVSYDLIDIFAFVLIDSNKSEEDLAWFCGDETAKFGIDITSYSTSGGYRYKSFTDYSTLENVNKKSISYDGWVTASEAGFK